MFHFCSTVLVLALVVSTSFAPIPPSSIRFGMDDEKRLPQDGLKINGEKLREGPSIEELIKGIDAESEPKWGHKTEEFGAAILQRSRGRMDGDKRKMPQDGLKINGEKLRLGHSIEELIKQIDAESEPKWGHTISRRPIDRMEDNEKKMPQDGLKRLDGLEEITKIISSLDGPNRGHKM